MTALDETWTRIRAANEAAGWAGWPLAARDQIEAMADDLNRDLRYPIVHAWAVNRGSQLKFWCVGCKGYHVHGRHSGPSFAAWARKAEETAHPDSPLSAQMWETYVHRVERCTYNIHVPGGRGTCTCPMGSGDGHRAPHCWRADSPFQRYGYVLHEVEPNDARATAKPSRLRIVK